ncbi:MAG: AsnC family transcriptional regulator [Solirubrobacterales bacterium]
MELLDARILNLIQTGFPLEARPFAAIGAAVGISEAECLTRVARLKERGVIRRIGAVFNSPAMGMTSTLCAARVETARIEETAAVISGYDQVTHNYQRDHALNLWFTVTGRSVEDRDAVIREIEGRTGLAIYSLPVRKAFKIRAVFQIDEE